MNPLKNKQTNQQTKKQKKWVWESFLFSFIAFLFNIPLLHKLNAHWDQDRHLFYIFTLPQAIGFNCSLGANIIYLQKDLKNNIFKSIPNMQLSRCFLKGFLKKQTKS